MLRRRPAVRDLVALAIVTPWLAWALVRTAGLDDRHPLVAIVSFTPYAALTAPVAIIAALALRRRAIAALALVAAVLLAGAVVDRVRGGPQQASASEAGPTLRVMTANVLGGRGDARAVMALVERHRIDVLSLQELTPEAVRALDAAGARRLLPGRAVQPRVGAAGSGLMARLPLRDAVLAEPDGTGAQPEALIDVPGAGALLVKAVHPFPPLSSPTARTWRAGLRALPDATDGAVPRVLLGDFNATLDHDAFRALLHRGYVDAADATGNGLRATWPVGRAGPSIAIDHILFPRGLRVRGYGVHEIPGSDHRAVIAELVLPAA